MKRLFMIMIPVLACLALGSCQGEDGGQEIDYTLTPADILLPEQDYVADIDEYEPLTFTWTEAQWDGYGVVTYDIVFARQDGDLASPVMVFHAASLVDTLRTQRTLSKDEIKSLYAAASLTSKDREVAVQWTVRSAAGGKKLVSQTVGRFSMTMSPDPDPFVPGNDIFVDGPGALEAGQKMTYIPSIDFDVKTDNNHYNDNSPRCKDFDYEVFTNVKAGEPIYLWSGTTSGGKDWYFTFSESSEKFTKSIEKDADLTLSLPQDGVWRIRLNSTTGDFYAKRVNSVAFRYWAGPKDTDMDYQGNGVWSKRITVAADAFGFKVLFKGLDADQPYGSQYPNETDSSKEEFWRVHSVQGGAAQNGKRANGTWLFPAEVLGVEVEYTINMNADHGGYCLHYELIN